MNALASLRHHTTYLPHNDDATLASPATFRHNCITAILVLAAAPYLSGEQQLSGLTVTPPVDDVTALLLPTRRHGRAMRRRAYLTPPSTDCVVAVAAAEPRIVIVLT